MNTIAMKLQTGTAALAIAAAATLIPVSAQAAPAIEMPTAPVTQILDQLAEAPAPWWFFIPDGGANTVDTTPFNNGVTLLHIDIPILTPLVLKPVFGALGILGLNLCFGGLAGLHINEYTGAVNVTVFGCHV